MLKSLARSIIYRLFGYFRLLWMKIKGRKRIRIGKNSMHAPSSEIICEGLVSIEKNVAVLKSASLICRKEGVLTLGENTTIGIRCYIVCHNQIQIGRNTEIAQDVKIYDHDHDIKTNREDDSFWKKNFTSSPVIIGNNCWIGSNVVILQGTQIGDNCVVGAGCVLKGSYPNNSIIIQKKETTVVKRGDRHD